MALLPIFCRYLVVTYIYLLTLYTSIYALMNGRYEVLDGRRKFAALAETVNLSLSLMVGRLIKY